MTYKKFRCAGALLLFIFACAYAVIIGDYARACFDLLLAAVTYPEAWLPEPSKEVKP